MELGDTWSFSFLSFLLPAPQTWDRPGRRARPTRLMRMRPEIWRRLRHGRAILARRGCAVVHPRIRIVQDRLAAAHPAREIRQHLQMVPARRKRLAHARGHAVLDHHVAPAKSKLGEAGSLQRRLDIHLLM